MQLFEQSEELGMVVDVVQVVEHHVQTLPRVAFPQLAEGLADFVDTTTRAEDAVQLSAVDIVEGEEMLDPVGTFVGSAHADRTFLAGPRYAARWADFQWSPLVEADHNSAGRASAIEPPDQFFLRSKCGSLEVFQVRIRCAVRPSRRNRRRTHSSVTVGSKRLARQ